MVLFLMTEDFCAEVGKWDSKLMFWRDELFGEDADEMGLAEISSEFDCLTGVFGKTSWALGAV